MQYKGYEIVAEAITARAEYKLDKNGKLTEFISDIDCEPEAMFYGMLQNGEMIDWADTIQEVKQCIDELERVI